MSADRPLWMHFKKGKLLAAYADKVMFHVGVFTRPVLSHLLCLGGKWPCGGY